MRREQSGVQDSLSTVRDASECEVWAKVIRTLLRVAPGLALIVGLSAALLVLDRVQDRRTGSREDVIAIFQPASRPAVDEMVEGVLLGLRERGFEPERNLRVHRFNAEGDTATAAGIARTIVTERPRLVVTVMTHSLQAMAAANRDGKVTHLFCGVTDPFGAGVGVSTTEHPPHLVGFGTSQPVRDAYLLARRLLPGLKRVGVVWNPSETPSQYGMKHARAVCRELGIELLEATADTSTAVVEGAKAVTGRGAQALWIGPDNTADMCAPTIVQVARAARIPVFGSVPGHAAAGCLFGHGSADVEVGKLGGRMAADILKGADPRAMRVRDIVPVQVAYNLKALEGLREAWRIPPELLKEAYFVIGRDGVRREVVSAGPAPVAAQRWRIHKIDYMESVTMEEVQRGFADGLTAAGLAAGRDYDLHVGCAQGDVATLSTLVEAARSDRADLIVVTSTPGLQATLNKVTDTPVVFTFVANGVLAGAGRSVTDHRPNVTGSTCESDFPGMVRLIRECFPGARRIGSLYTPHEPNSVYYRDRFLEAMKGSGMELVTMPVSSTSEVPDAAQALARRVEVVAQIQDNLLSASYPAVAKAAQQARRPFLAFGTTALRMGAALVLARDEYEAGREGAALVARVIRGAQIARIPFTPLKKTVLLVSRRNAAACGMKIPPAVLRGAGKVVD